MATGSDFRYEQFIDQYEHIVKLNLLTDDELTQLKKKRNHHETLIKSAGDVKIFVDYIHYEITLLAKFHQMEYQSKTDRIAIEYACGKHIKELFRLAIQRFKDKRKLWEMYIGFCKQKFKNQVTRLYEEMLHYHHKVDDFAEAADHEMSTENFQSAMNFLMQGIAMNKENNEKLVLLYVECSAKRAQSEMSGKDAALEHAMKSYDRFMKPIDDVKIHCELMRRLEKDDESIMFQDYVIEYLKGQFGEKAELWQMLAQRHIAGIFEVANEDEAEEKQKIPRNVCIQRGVETYERAFESVEDGSETKKMFEYFIDALLDLEDQDNTDEIRNLLRKSLGKALKDGFESDQLSIEHFLTLLRLRLINMDKNQAEIEQMIEKGQKLYPTSMEFFEIAIKFHFLKKDFEKVKSVFNIALLNNKKDAIALYRFLCKIYLSKSLDRELARSAMLEAINSSNKELSEAFQAFYIEYLALTDGIEKAKETFQHLLKTKPLGSLSIDFFKIMIKLEEEQETPDNKLIRNCYERATEHFGRENVEIWIDFVKFLWRINKHREADDIRKRALIYLKKDAGNINEFDRQLTQLRMTAGMDE